MQQITLFAQLPLELFAVKVHNERFLFLLASVCGKGQQTKQQQSYSKSHRTPYHYIVVIIETHHKVMRLEIFFILSLQDEEPYDGRAFIVLNDIQPILYLEFEAGLVDLMMVIDGECLVVDVEGVGEGEEVEVTGKFEVVVEKLCFSHVPYGPIYLIEMVVLIVGYEAVNFIC